MKPYDQMTDAEFYVECADVVQHMALQIATIARETAALHRHDDGEGSDWRATASLTVGMRAMMDGLGDVLNGMDASTDNDRWTDAIF